MYRNVCFIPLISGLPKILCSFQHILCCIHGGFAQSILVLPKRSQKSGRAGEKRNSYNSRGAFWNVRIFKNNRSLRDITLFPINSIL